MDYIKQTFESYGYETELQPFQFPGWNCGTSSIQLSELTVNGGDVHTFEGSVNDTVTAPLTYVGLARANDVSSADLQGKIALIERGEISFYEKIQNVLDAGAVGVIMFNRVGAEGNEFDYAYDGQNILLQSAES
ncbi:hypothetical protein N781_08840 [Pontibacillus halophilus JSM 076056 = DSM 19796]|uniref:PA domain-containing protein n=1 Tax=Pontibacillus halophilus JSM 076056 = DSM 19796 TaxID=1385510 RepID=A0A0A5I2D9_9BACI|nr:PA domain-containing protein [Pontibacillus halophilus]KGX89987.1 hypothetical protein N781_08840 [Pontibacillus halophilus JSM 076056 = DSM 19796]